MLFCVILLLKELYVLVTSATVVVVFVGTLQRSILKERKNKNEDNKFISMDVNLVWGGGGLE